jgi:uncharacterized membrane protein YhhN
MKRIWLTIFFLAGVSQIVAQFLPEGWLHWLSKPMLMISLAGYYVGSTRKISFSIVVFVAILFSFFGDVFLLFQDSNGIYFIVGLVSFLVAHIFYVFAYRQHVNTSAGTGLNNIQKIRFSFPFMLLGTGLVTVLYPGLGDLRLPVVIYAIVLVAMVLAALFRYERTTTTSFWMVFGGALFFMVSDSVLAINKFYSPIASSGVWIMITYILAQFMIVQGLIKHQK